MEYKIIIPARAGSKRLPGKNMKILENKPLIQHSIDFALNCFRKDSVWVNSDDKEVIDFCEKFEVNLLVRPNSLATDFTSMTEVIKHHVEYFQMNNIDCDAVILLQPSNPLRSKEIFSEAVDLFEKSGRNSLATFSVSEKKLGKIINGRFNPANYTPGQRSQDLEESYYENGLIYVTKVKSILNNKIITDDVYPLVCEDVESTVDIDYLHDFLFAETILKMKNENK